MGMQIGTDSANDPTITVYDGVEMPTEDYVDRSLQENYTSSSFGRGQGCSQMIGAQVSFSDVRFIRCTRCDGSDGGPLAIDLVGLSAGPSSDAAGLGLVLFASGLFFTLIWLLVTRRISLKR